MTEHVFLFCGWVISFWFKTRKFFFKFPIFVCFGSLAAFNLKSSFRDKFPDFKQIHILSSYFRSKRSWLCWKTYLIWWNGLSVVEKNSCFGSKSFSFWEKFHCFEKKHFFFKFLFSFKYCSFFFQKQEIFLEKKKFLLKTFCSKIGTLIWIVLITQLWVFKNCIFLQFIIINNCFSIK